MLGSRGMLGHFRPVGKMHGVVPRTFGYGGRIWSSGRFLSLLLLEGGGGLTIRWETWVLVSGWSTFSKYVVAGVKSVTRGEVANTWPAAACSEVGGCDVSWEVVGVRNEAGPLTTRVRLKWLLHLRRSPVEYTFETSIRLLKGGLERTRTEEGWSREGITKSWLDLFWGMR